MSPPLRLITAKQLSGAARMKKPLGLLIPSIINVINLFVIGEC